MTRSRLHPTVVAVFLLALSTGSAAAEEPKTFAFEIGQASLSADWDGEGPAGSGLRHRGDLDDASTFGGSFEYRFTRHLGLRGGFLRSDLPIRAESGCPNGPCSFTAGPARVMISEGVTWSVEEDSELQTFFLEVPVVARRGRVELFAGPTLAHLDAREVVRPGLEGLRVSVDASATVGLHLGGSAHFGRWPREEIGPYVRPWSVGLIARWIPTDFEVTVSQPTLGQAGRELFRAEGEEDLVVVTLVLGRRFGGTD